MIVLKFSLVIILVNQAICRRRHNVVIKGTTESPGFSRLTAKWSPKCPDSHVAFNHGQHCCNDPFRTQSCPGFADGDKNHLHEDDPLECCSDPNPLVCQEDQCFSNNYPFAVRVICPMEYPTAIDRSRRCCAYLMRSSSCPSGPEGSPLEPDDHVECCPDRNVQPCFNHKRQWSYCVSRKCQHPKIHSHDEFYFHQDHDFRPENIFIETCERDKGDKYYLSKNGATNVGFIIDMGCVQTIKEIRIKNTINSEHRDRATRAFKIEVSSDLSTWYEILNDQLKISLSEPCWNVPVESFPISRKAPSRFLKYTMISFYGHGGGLNYLTWTPY